MPGWVSPVTGSSVRDHTPVDQADLLTAATLDQINRVILDRATTNILPNPTFAGTYPGTLGTGGTLPASFERTDTVSYEILPAPAGRFRYRIFRTGGTPTTASTGIRTPPRPGLTPPSVSRGGIATSGWARIITATPNVTAVVPNQTVYSAANVYQRSVQQTITAAQRDTFFALWTSVNPGETVTFGLPVTLTGTNAATDDFSATIELWNLQMEDAAGSEDYTSFTPSARPAAQTATIRFGTATGGSALAQSTDRGGIWTDGTGDTPLDTGESRLIEAVHLTPPLTVDQKSVYSAANYPVVWDQTPADKSIVRVGGANLLLQRPAQTSAFAVAKNRRGQFRIELRDGWVWPSDPPAGNTNQRCEVQFSENMPYDTDVWLSYAQMIEPGTDITDFALCGQFKTPADPLGVGPILSGTLYPGNYMVWYTRGDTAVPPSPTAPLIEAWRTNLPPRGTWFRYVHRLQFSQTGGGHLQSWFNGTQTFNDPVAMGYNETPGPFWKLGIYKHPTADTIAVQYANVEIGTADLSARIGSPLPIS